MVSQYTDQFWQKLLLLHMMKDVHEETVVQHASGLAIAMAMATKLEG